MADRTGIMAQGDLAEQSRLAKTGGANLNEFSSSDNFPQWDLANSKTFESVKGYASPQQLIAVLRDMQAGAEWATSKMLTLREQAARALCAKAQALHDQGAWPEGLPVDANPATVAEFGRNNGIVSGPDDAVVEARDQLPTEVRENAPIYGLDESSPDFEQLADAKVAELTNRLQECGQTCEQLVQHAEASVATPAERGYAMPQPTDGSVEHTTPAAEPAQSPSQSGAAPSTVPMWTEPTSSH
jgi:hypothetical protein